jgi:hypothetical protein
MAVGAGIATSDVRVLEVGGHAHLLVRRFDVTDDGARLHQHTLGGLLHVDYEDVRRIQLELDARRREVFGRGPA